MESLQLKWFLEASGVPSQYCIAGLIYSALARLGAMPETIVSLQEELKGMAGRIKSMRAQLLQALKDVGAPGSWDHVVNQIGMFSFLGVTKVCSSSTAPPYCLLAYSG